MMPLFMLSVPEAAMLFLGIAIQAITAGALSALAAPIIAVNALILLARGFGSGNPQAVVQPLSYVVSSLIIMALFLPGAFGFGGGTTINAEQVQSFAAVEGDGSVPDPPASSAPNPPSNLRIIN